MNRSLIIGSILTLLFIGAAALSLSWTPHAPEAMNISARLQAPSLLHPLGTDHFGRDILSLIMTGARTSIAVALVAANWVYVALASKPAQAPR